MTDRSKQNLAQTCLPSRRWLLWAGATGLTASLVAPGAHAADEKDTRFKPYDRDTRFEVGQRGKDMQKKAYELGHRYEAKHGGCARCTVAALQEALDFVPDAPGLFRAATCLDGGATPTGKQNCGGFTGSGIVIGYLCGGEDFKSTALAHRLVRRVARRFEDRYGSVLCPDVRKGVDGDCPEAVGRAARWTAEVLLGQFTDYQPE